MYSPLATLMIVHVLLGFVDFIEQRLQPAKRRVTFSIGLWSMLNPSFESLTEFH